MPPIMDWDEYVREAHDCGIAQDQIIMVTKHFNRIGLQFLSSFSWFDPSWCQFTQSLHGGHPFPLLDRPYICLYESSFAIFTEPHGAA